MNHCNERETSSVGTALTREGFAIGILSVTAVILFVGVLVVVSLPQPASAIGQTDRGGDYLMVTSQFTNNWEVAMITDGAVGRMGAYFYNINTRSVELVDMVEFARFMRAPGGARSR